MNGVMIALLPVFAPWVKQDLPHLTLVYSGETGDHKPMDLLEMIKDASSLAAISKPITTPVIGLEVFGKEDDRVDVFTVRLTPELMAMRNFVEKWHRSEWNEFKPHVTIGPSPSMVLERPQMIAFDKVMVAWGDRKFTFNMGVPARI